VERKGTFEQVRRRGWRAKRALQIRVHLILQSVAPLGDLFNGIYSMGFIQGSIRNNFIVAESRRKTRKIRLL
jgi:hypothetical protein